MKITLGWMMLTLMAAASVAGCDRRKPSPAPAPQSRPAPAASTGAQALLAEPRKSIELGIYPLKVTVPGSWSVENTGVVTFLKGPTPSGAGFDGQTRIQCFRPPTIATDVADKLFGDAQSEEKRKSDDRLAMTTRIQGKARFIERRTVEQHPGDKEPMVTWTLDILVSRENSKTMLYRLTFVGMTRAAYDKDVAFLSPIIASVHYDPTLDGEVQP